MTSILLYYLNPSVAQIQHLIKIFCNCHFFWRILLHSIREDLAEGWLINVFAGNTHNNDLYIGQNRRTNLFVKGWGNGEFWFSRDFFVPYFQPPGSCFPSLICPRIVCVCNVLSVHKYSKNFCSPCFTALFTNMQTPKLKSPIDNCVFRCHQS